MFLHVFIAQPFSHYCNLSLVMSCFFSENQAVLPFPKWKWHPFPAKNLSINRRCHIFFQHIDKHVNLFSFLICLGSSLSPIACAWHHLAHFSLFLWQIQTCVRAELNDTIEFLMKLTNAEFEEQLKRAVSTYLYCVIVSLCIFWFS